MSTVRPTRGDQHPCWQLIGEIDDERVQDVPTSGGICYEAVRVVDVVVLRARIIGQIVSADAHMPAAFEVVDQPPLAAAWFDELEVWREALEQRHNRRRGAL